MTPAEARAAAAIVEINGPPQSRQRLAALLRQWADDNAEPAADNGEYAPIPNEGEI